MPVLPADLSAAVANALAEDVGSGDLTAALVSDRVARARVISREQAVICGRPWFDEVFRQVDPDIFVEWAVDEGERVAPDTELCRLSGPAPGLLTGERTALNFLQSLSGTATVTRRYADAVAGTKARVLDTRKTLPGLRRAQKYAVLCGGGSNHRMGLFDAVLIKENHILAAGSIRAAVLRARTLYPQISIEVEVESLEELKEALSASPNVVMLDNFDLENMRNAVAVTKDRLKLEASGNVSLETIRAIAETGVDYVSVGAITKDVKAVDLSMRFDLSGERE